MKKTIVVMATLIVVCAAFVPVALVDSFDSDASFSITETIPGGRTVDFDGPVKHIICFGASFTNTLCELGAVNKAVLFDDYSEFSKSGIAGVNGKPSDMFIKYNAGNFANVQTKLLEMVSNGSFDKNTDAILAYGYSYLNNNNNTLINDGYKVLRYYPKTYNDGIEMTKDMGLLVGVNSNKIVSKMESGPAKIQSKLSAVDINDSNRIKAVSISTGKLQVRGSMGAELIQLGGGTNVADIDGGSSTSVALQESFFTQNPTLNVIFYLPTSTMSTSSFKTTYSIPDTVRIVETNTMWTTYGPGLLKGLWGFAAGMYPECFRDSGSVIPAPTISPVVAANKIIQYNANGGKFSDGTTAFSGTGEIKFDKMPVRDNYIFLGWAEYADASAATYLPGSSVAVVKDTSVYAIWGVKPAPKITYNGNGGSFDGADALTGDKTVRFDKVPKRDGFKFIGWSDDPNSAVPKYPLDYSGTVDSNTELYSIWEAESRSESNMTQYLIIGAVCILLIVGAGAFVHFRNKKSGI